jgi:hypothetical protein
MFCDVLEVSIALSWPGLVILTQHRRCSRRDDHFSIRMPRGDSVVHTLLIVSSITGEGGEWSCDLVKQGPNLRAIIDIAGRQL